MAVQDPAATSFDFTLLRAKGYQHLKDFFGPEFKADLILRAQQIADFRATGKLTTFDQDSQGLSYEWFEPLVRHPQLVELITRILGPDVCASGWRILVKDKHFKNAIHVHQDWPYNPGDTKKVTVFLPLTRVNKENGGLFFLEESHFYGPVSRGPIDISRFPAMTAACPDIDVGDAVLCDFLTWHYSEVPETVKERVMIQINYQPASDTSSSNLVAGTFPHNRRGLMSRFDAVSVPSVELNCREARACYERGEIDRATRFARGLLFDDPDHIGASLLLHDILNDQGQVEAVQHLEAARLTLRRLAAELAKRDGVAADDLGDLASVTSGRWRPVALSWADVRAGYHPIDGVPDRLDVPDHAWGYGAISQALEVPPPAVVRITARCIAGKVRFSLINSDASEVVSESIGLSPQDGEVTFVLSAKADQDQTHILVSNHGVDGLAGSVQLIVVEFMQRTLA